MSKRANPAVLGLFVVLALAGALGTVFVLGSGRFFRDTVKAVLYFKGSVAGLDSGAPVEYNGVRLGSVTDVNMVSDESQGAVRIPVYVELDSHRVAGLGRIPGTEPGARLRQGIAAGLRGRLATQSFITGKLKIELTQHPAAKPEAPQEENGRIVIPTVAGAFDAWAQKIESLPLQQIVLSLEGSLRNLSILLASPDLQAIVSNLNATTRSTARLAEDLRLANLAELADQMRELAMQMRASLPPAEIHQAFTNLNATLIQAQTTLSDLSGSVGPLREEALRTIDEIGEAARSVRLLSDYIERHPEALLRGKREKGE